MPNPKQMSGVPLPADDLPAGTMSVRVDSRQLRQEPRRTRRSSSLVDGKTAHGADGRGRPRRRSRACARGAQVRAVAVVDGERLESQEVVDRATRAFAFVLVADRSASVERARRGRRALAAAPAVKGTVVFGPESRVIARVVERPAEHLLRARDPQHRADAGRHRRPADRSTCRASARGATLLRGVVAAGDGERAARHRHRAVRAGHDDGARRRIELPYSGHGARLEQTWPAPLQQLTMLVLQIGGLDIASPQIADEARGRPSRASR